LNKKFAAALMALALIGQLGLAAFAEDETGTMTNDYPVAWGIVSFPLRLVTGALGMGLGAVVGGVNGIVETEKKFAENTFGRADENPLMVPVGLVGTVVAIPVGFLTGFPPEAIKGGEEGFGWWDRF
jgi:hypothetical protein